MRAHLHRNNSDQPEAPEDPPGLRVGQGLLRKPPPAGDPERKPREAATEDLNSPHRESFFFTTLDVVLGGVAHISYEYAMKLRGVMDGKKTSSKATSRLAQASSFDARIFKVTERIHAEELTKCKSKKFEPKGFRCCMRRSLVSAGWV